MLFSTRFKQTGWCFGTWLLLFHSVGNVITPTDFHIFQRDWNHQPVVIFHSFWDNPKPNWRSPSVFRGLEITNEQIIIAPSLKAPEASSGPEAGHPTAPLGVLHGYRQWIGLVMGNIFTGNHRFSIDLFSHEQRIMGPSEVTLISFISRLNQSIDIGFPMSKTWSRHVISTVTFTTFHSWDDP